MAKRKRKPEKQKAVPKEDPKKWENMLALQFALHDLARFFKREFIIKELGRKFRWDFADPVHKVAIEFQGAIWVKGGHSTGRGIQRDHAKGNLAQFHGWTVFYFDDREVRTRAAVKLVDKFYQQQLKIDFMQGDK